MNLGLIVIGDEILSGKRQDKHFAKVVELLARRGMKLDWALYLGDDRQRLTAALRASFASGDTVFSFGGIGITPDDHTRQAAAAALGVGLCLHPQAEREIRARYGYDVTRHAHESAPQDAHRPCADEEAMLRKRLMLGEFPEGSDIIPNPYNRIPGFSIRNHWFFPGFPVMAWPMLEWVLDMRLAHLHHTEACEERAILVHEAPESALLELMNGIVRDYPGVKLFSLPSYGGAGMPPHIELGVRGEPEAVRRAIEDMRAELRRLGYAWSEKK